MREVKFRVKGTTGDKLWLYINLPSIFNGGSIWYEGMDWKTLSQYTGLKDKNGTEIYKGDIVGYFWLEKINRYYDTVPILFEAGQFCVYINGLAFHKRLDIYGLVDKFEVIGNIYDNPELLEHS